MIDVSCALVLNDLEQVLAVRRGPAQSMPGCWELPGGKLEPGESAADSLVRELREELGITVTVQAALPPVEHAYPAFSIRLHPFVVRISDGTPVLTEHDALRWLHPADFPGLDWAAADVPVWRGYLAGQGFFTP